MSAEKADRFQSMLALVCGTSLNAPPDMLAWPSISVIEGRSSVCPSA